ncbi:MAG: hypothetical protein JWN84_381 [Nocardioides sp.]|nr:hypothetical protein [Nocardioides sp.]
MNDAAPIPLTERYVVPPDGRRRLAWASVRFTLLVAPGQRVFYGLVVAFALVVQSLEGWSPLGTAVASALEIVVVGLVLSFVWATTVGFSQTYHSTRHRFPEGAVLGSGFGEDAFVLRVPTGDVRVPVEGLRRLRPRGDFVFISTDGLGGHAIFPRALFPDDQVTRLNARHDA